MVATFALVGSSRYFLGTISARFVREGEMAEEWWESYITSPTAKRSIKYGGIAIGILDLIKTLSELPDTFQKDTEFIGKVFGFLGHFFIYGLQTAIIVLCLIIPAFIAMAFVMAGLQIVTGGAVKEENASDVLIFLGYGVAIVAGIALQYGYGFTGTFTLAGTFFEYMKAGLIRLL
jgi:hypothetical protein